MASYAALALRLVVDISTDCTMLRRDWPLRAGALNCCTAEAMPSGSAKRVDWQGIRMPVCRAVGAGLPPSAGDASRELVEGDQVVLGDRDVLRRRLRPTRTASGRPDRRSGPEAQRCHAGAAGVLERRLDALRVGDGRAAEHQRADGRDRADGGVRTPPGRCRRGG